MTNTTKATAEVPYRTTHREEVREAFVYWATHRSVPTMGREEAERRFDEWVEDERESARSDALDSAAWDAAAVDFYDSQGG